MTSIVGLALFVATYVAISSRRVQRLGFDRATLVWFGALAFLALGLLTPAQALHSIDAGTLILLVAMMGIGVVLTTDRIFEAIELWLEHKAWSQRRLLGATIWGPGLLSALITNDAVCALLAPLLVQMITRKNLPKKPFLLALASSANTGSAMTLVGNPQNMLCGSLGELRYADYLVKALPITLAALVINHALVVFLFRDELHSESIQAAPHAPIPIPKLRLDALVLAVTVLLYLTGVSLAWAAVAGLVLMLVTHRGMPSVWRDIDWSLIVFFAGLFIVVAGLTATGLPREVFERVPLWDGSKWALPRLAAIFLAGSNLVSNVPFILVVREQMTTLPAGVPGWELLALVSTFAGNLTVLGSVANVIVLESARSIGGFSFGEHLRLGVPLTLATVALATAYFAF